MDRKMWCRHKWDAVFLVLCLGLLFSSLGAVGPSGRRRAKEFVCLANLHRWGTVFEAFVEDNDGYFLSGNGGGIGFWWIETLWPYHEDRRLLLCPQAPSPVLGPEPPNPAFLAWQANEYVGSYGVNGWVCNVRDEWGVWGRSPGSEYWKRPDVQGSGNIPVFGGMWWVDAWPRAVDVPPAAGGMLLPDRPNLNEMQRLCVNRHNGAENLLFMDFSARKVGLKELWTLKWHRSYNTEGPWTKAGGALPSDWPQWMRPFKDY